MSLAQPVVDRARSSRASILVPFEFTQGANLYDRNDVVISGEGYSKHIHAGYGGAFNEVTLSDTAKSRVKTDQEHLIALLRQRGGGNLLRGWRCELDPNGAFEVSFQDFCEVAGSLGYQGNAFELFGQDQKGDTLSLSELSPDIGALVERFTQWVKATFGGPTKMFRSYKPEGKGELCAEEFAELVKRDGFTCTEDEFAELFSLCDIEHQGFFKKEDVLFLESDARTREMEIFKLRMQRKDQRQHDLASEYCKERDKDMSATHRLAPRPWLVRKFEQLPMVLCQRRVNWQIESMKKEKQARRTFMNHLHAVYGNEIRAWRLGLDPEDSFTVSLNRLRTYCRRNDLPLSVPDLWNSLDSDKNGAFDMAEVCAKQASVLAQFREWAHSEFGSCAAVWDSREAAQARGEIDHNHHWASTKKMLLQPFVECLRNIGWPEIGRAGHRSLLLSSLDKYGCGFISRKDLEWLDAWQPHEWLAAEPDENAMKELKDLMLHQYGHALRAWRCVMDRDDSNAVNWDEFKAACIQLGFKGNSGGAWRVLDTDLSGLISLKEFDPPSAELLGSFKHWADYNFGSVELAFRVLDADQDGAVTYHELRRTCRRLKWSGDVKLFFECLDVDGHTSHMHGKRTITLDEVIFLDHWHMDVPEASEGMELNPQAGGGQRLSVLVPPTVGKRRVSRVGLAALGPIQQLQAVAEAFSSSVKAAHDEEPAEGSGDTTKQEMSPEASMRDDASEKEGETHQAAVEPGLDLTAESDAAAIQTSTIRVVSDTVRPASQGSSRPRGATSSQLPPRPTSQGSIRRPMGGSAEAAWPAGPCCGNLPPSRPGTQGTTHGTVSRPDTRGTVGTGASWLSTTACSDRSSHIWLFKKDPPPKKKSQPIRWSQQSLAHSPYAKKGGKLPRRRPMSSSSMPTFTT
mmetsp:Transcript_36837/g.84885  ORF Transcript_36837/g.84885 Transcript_36837/m.84885 type:complete len:912 (+) Transcript_36837:142-2877(+)